MGLKDVINHKHNGARGPHQRRVDTETYWNHKSDTERGVTILSASSRYGHGLAQLPNSRREKVEFQIWGSLKLSFGVQLISNVGRLHAGRHPHIFRILWVYTSHILEQIRIVKECQILCYTHEWPFLAAPSPFKKHKQNRAGSNLTVREDARTPCGNQRLVAGQTLQVGIFSG